MRCLTIKTIIGMLALATASVAWGGQAPSRTSLQNPPGKAAARQSDSAAVNSSTYVIGPTDVLNISVWKEPNITGTVTVRPDGKISLPLINDIQAAGLTPMVLSKHITKALQKYVTDPQVTVIVKAANSQRVFVVGDVNHPGEIALLPNMTVLDALASAGGPSQFANRKKIYILRHKDGKQVRSRFNYIAAIKGDLQQNIVLRPGDTIVVP